MNQHDRDRDDDPDGTDGVDPTHDSWSAWLPQLDQPTSPTSPTSPTTPSSPPRPLPQASGPPPRTDPVPPRVPPAPPLPYAVTRLPGWPGTPRVGPPPATYFGWAVVCTIVCFMPLGVVAIVKSLQVRPRWAQGDWAGAQKASRAAKTWCLIAAAIWPGALLLFSCLGALSGGHMSHF
ncbi:CD225/dispanin family protein [Terrabacter terrigena]|uniref:CD225/dispanin family protein n=1 Tax=Terrabacter terrigena TaxID=574718 RepID=A0ABW3N249_9MICO